VARHSYRLQNGATRLEIDLDGAVAAWYVDDEAVTANRVLRQAPEELLHDADRATRRAIRDIRDAAGGTADDVHRQALRALAARIWREHAAAAAGSTPTEKPRLPGM